MMFYGDDSLDVCAVFDSKVMPFFSSVQHTFVFARCAPLTTAPPRVRSRN
jgi:hypothetical protein